jgi:hypothetical protein
VDGLGWNYLPGDLRVSDADRDRALCELREAFQAGRITADEFDQRSGQAVGARTGKELTALLADLPLARPAAACAVVPEPASHAVVVRSVMGASAVCAILLFAKAVTVAVTPDHVWVGTAGPAAIAVVLVVLIIYLHAKRADRP